MPGRRRQQRRRFLQRHTVLPRPYALHLWNGTGPGVPLLAHPVSSTLLDGGRIHVNLQDGAGWRRLRGATAQL